MKKDAALKLALVGSLYVSQAVPLGFFIVAVPVILRSQGLSLERVGLLSAIALPFLVKFLWAPLVDRLGAGRPGHFRSWILPLQSLAVATVVAIACLDLSRHFLPLVVLGALFMLLAATQDVATDGLSVSVLARDERGPGNGVQVGGYYLGQVLGGGGALLVYDRFGWTPAVLALAAVLALPILPALAFREPAAAVPAAARPGLAAIGRFFRRAGARGWVAVLLLYRAGETMAVTMFNPMLVDLGFSLAEIGVLLGVASSLGSLAGALAGGFLIRAVGRKEALVGFAVAEAAALGGFLLPAVGVAEPAVVWGAAVAAAFTGGMATAALYTVMMDGSAMATAATDFSLQQSLAAVGPLVAASLSGVSAAALGYPGHFALSIAATLAAAALVARTLPAAGREVAAAEAAT